MLVVVVHVGRLGHDCYARHGRRGAPLRLCLGSSLRCKDSDLLRRLASGACCRIADFRFACLWPEGCLPRSLLSIWGLVLTCSYVASLLRRIPHRTTSNHKPQQL